MLDEASSPLAIKDDQFEQVLSNAGRAGPVGLPPDPLLALPEPLPESVIPPSFKAFVVAIPRAMALKKLDGFTELWGAKRVGGASIQVHMDSGYHSVGIRAWVRCINPRHSPCFKWRHVSSFASRADAVKWLAAWALDGGSDPLICRSGHKLYAPVDGSVAHFRASLIC